MKHFIYGVLFFLIFLPISCFATIELTISNLTPKDDYFELSATVTGMSSSSATFVQGMFTKVDTTKYFGFTLSRSGSWLSYDGSPEKSFVLDNFVELQNNSPQVIFVKPNYQDPDYQGEGRYLLKLKRYTASGSPSDYSNSLELDLNYSSPTTTPTPTPTPNETMSPTTSSPTATTYHQSTTVTPPPPTSTKTPTTITVSPTASISPVKSGIPITPSGGRSPRSELGERDLTPSPPPQVLATTSSNTSTETSSIIIDTPIPTIDLSSTISSPILSDKNLFLVGILIFLLSGGLLYFRLRNL